MRVPGFALIHRARIVKTTRTSPRDEQGERLPAEAHGPWFPCRRTTRRPSSKGPPDAGGARRGERPWLLIYGDEDELGMPLTPPSASDELEVEVPTAVGVEVLRYTITAVPATYDAGGGAFGGQVELGEVVPAS